MRDTTLMAAEDHRLREHDLTDDDRRDATNLVRARLNPADALEVLQMLGLAADTTPADPAATPASLEAVRLHAQRTRAQARAQTDPSRIPHGTPGGYDYWRCRCDVCTAYNSDRSRKYRNAAKGTAS